jgi:hypothetical protein
MTATDLRATADRLDGISDPTALFGPPVPEAIRQARTTYHRLAAVTHPDRAGDRGAAGDDLANRAFCRLNELWNDWLATARPRVTTNELIFDTGRRRYRLGARRAVGDLCDLFVADGLSDDAEDRGDLLVKFPRAAIDNDLLVTEAKALSRLAQGPERLRPYVPKLVDALRHRDERNGIERRVNVLGSLGGFVTLADVKRAFPAGLDPRDAAWMWRRTLVALGFIHREGIVHCAVVPEHVMIHPGMHGVVLVDFCFAAIAPARRLVATVPGFRDWYPADAIAQRRAEPALDLVLAAHLFDWLIAPEAPRPIRRFLHGCLSTPDRLRPADAWQLLRELDGLLEDLYGPRRFRPFTMPAPPDGPLST